MNACSERGILEVASKKTCSLTFVLKYKLDKKNLFRYISVL